jgi:hypothetical protein
MPRQHLRYGYVIVGVFCSQLAVAQVPQPPPPQPQKPPAQPIPQRPDPNTPRGTDEADRPLAAEVETTVTGCLQRAPQGSKPGVFVLKNASSDPKAPASQRDAEVPGDRRAAQGTGAPAREYRLAIGSSTTRLDEYVGQQVEVKGRVAPEPDPPPATSSEGVSSSRPSGSTGTSTVPEPTERAPDTTGDSKIPTLHVSSVKTLAASCASAER